MVNKELEEILNKYKVEDYLNGKLEYDEFVEEVSTLINKEREDAVREFARRLVLNNYVSEVWETSSDRGCDIEVGDIKRFLQSYLSEKDDNDTN